MSWGLFVCVRSIPVCPGVRSCTFGPFPCALGDRRVRSDHSRASWRAYVASSIHVRAGDCRVRLIAFGPFQCAEGYVRSIPVRPGGGRVRSCAFGLIANAMVVVGFVCERPAHFRAP